MEITFSCPSCVVVESLQVVLKRGITELSAFWLRDRVVSSVL